MQTMKTNTEQRMQCISIITRPKTNLQIPSTLNNKYDKKAKRGNNS